MNLTEWEPPAGIDGVSFEEIYEFFADSPYGEVLRQRVRYGDYKPGEMSNGEWVKILGPDVNNLEHLKTSLAVAQDFVYRARDPHPEWRPGAEEIKFTRDEEELLCLTAIIHDWGEAVVGDILFHKKTEEDSEKEFEVLERLIEEIGCRKFADSLAEKMHLAAGIAFGKEERVSRAFNAIEHIGYGNNALRAWKEKVSHKGIVHETLAGLASKLISDHLLYWQAHARIYPGTHYWLLENEKILKEIQEANIDWRAVPSLANN